MIFCCYNIKNYKTSTAPECQKRASITPSFILPPCRSPLRTLICIFYIHYSFPFKGRVTSITQNIYNEIKKFEAMSI